MEGSVQLTVSRTSPEDVQQRQIILKLDGRKIATLMFGQSKTVELVPGKHTLLVDNTWKKKRIELEAEAGEHVRFKVVNQLGTLGWILATSFGAGPMKLTVEREG
jgi:hypothetical protein